MRSKKKNLLGLLTAIFLIAWAPSAEAYEFGLAAGLRTTDVDTDISGATISSGSGLTLGVLGFAEATNEIYIRSGVMYTQRNFDVKSANTAEVELTYLDVPVDALFMFNEMFGLYGGLLMSLKLSDDCKVGAADCAGFDFESLVYGLNFGGHIRFAPNIGIDIEYLMGMSDVASVTGSGTVEKASGVSVDLVYLF